MTSLNVSRTQRRLVITGALVVLAVVVGSVALLGGGDDTAADEGEELPEASFELFDGGTASLADFGGKPLVINFWASWCPACVAELPEFQAVHEARGDEVTFLGLANTDQRGPALALAGDVGLSYTLGDDPRGDIFRSLGLIAMPSTVFVTADGRVHDVFGGQLDQSGLSSRIDDLLEAS